MNAPVKLMAFLAVLAAVFVGAALAGATIEPDGRTGAGHRDGNGAPPPVPAHGSDGHGGGAEPVGDKPGASEHQGATYGPTMPGLAVAERGYGLQLDDTRLGRADRTQLRFRVVDRAGRTVREFATQHDKKMHLILVRRDLHYFQHVHPVMAADGVWSAPLELSQAGVYRVFADFKLGGTKLTLGGDLFVDGAFDALPIPAVSSVTRVDGYRVSVSRDGRGVLSFTVRRNGKVLDDIQPYLAARGHLVALREHDLAYLHTHPEEGASNTAIAFGVEYPTEGRYRLFMQFKHDNEIHTAAFTQEATQ